MKLVYITSTRADFGLMRSTLEELQKSPVISLQLIVTGTHLLQEYGYSVSEVEASGLPIAAKVLVPVEASNSSLSMALFSSKTMGEMAKVLYELKPDMVLLEADRAEILASAMAASILNIPIAHVSGGDVSQSLDDSFRHAISKLAHIHFPGTMLSAERLLRMGEEPWRVHMAGTPINRSAAPLEFVEKELSLTINPSTLLVIQHSVTTEVDLAGEHMKETLEALKELELQTVIVYPNNDAGSADISQQLKNYEDVPYFHFFKHIPSSVFMGLLASVGAIVGNSSSGIVEAPHFGTPCVNIGRRQFGRECGSNVIMVDHDKEAIKDAVKKALSPEFRALSKSYNPYSSDGVEARIRAILENVSLGPGLLQKKLDYGL